ncbi:MAG: rubredoxin [Burkholderiales bacterium]|nr:rubredoxin [Burkholderiales bacterium]MBH2017518.1 rubredoxin [Burkholderiales bacterium]
MSWECLICNWRYDPVTGAPAAGIAGGTPFDELPHDWTCPDCGAAKEDFFEVEAP